MAGTVSVTPLSKQQISCFCCLGTGIVKTFKLSGQKCKTESILSKICALTSQNEERIMCDLGELAALCRSCFRKIVDAYTLIEDLSCSIQHYADHQHKLKRMSTSPGTPGRLVVDDTRTRCKKKARRQLLTAPDSVTESGCTATGTGRRADNMGCGRESLSDATGTRSVALQPQHPPLDASRPSDVAAWEHGKLPVDHSYASTQKERGVSNNDPVDLSIGLHKNPVYTSNGKENLPLNPVDEQCVSRLRWALQCGDPQIIAELFDEIPDLLTAAKQYLLVAIDMQCQNLCSRTSMTASVLRKFQPVAQLCSCPDLFEEIYMEMKSMNPFLLDVLATVACGRGKHLDRKVIAPLAGAYAILMRQRNMHLSAWHRLSTVISLQGHMKDENPNNGALLMIKRCATTTDGLAIELHIMDEAVEQSHRNIVHSLKDNPLIKVTWDNLDIRMKTGQQGLGKHHQDLHYFASNAIFSRVKPDVSTKPPQIHSHLIKAESFLIHGSYKETLISSYGVLIGRIMQELPAFKWVMVPKHIPHSNQQAAGKTEVHPLPIQFQNEIRHEDCVKILDGYEDNLCSLYNDAHGNLAALNKFGIPVGGDQLTRIRMEEAKCLRTLATSPTKRFDHLHPFVIEWWHNKQDFLEKAYKALYSSKSLRQAGTLYYYKCKLGLSDVNGKVKSNFKAHHSLFTTVGKHLIIEQLLEYFGMADISAMPDRNVPDDVSTMAASDRRKVTETVTAAFLDYYGYGDFSPQLQQASSPTTVSYRVQEVLPDGSLVVVPVTQTAAPPPQPDMVYNYSMNLCHWALHLMELDDTAKEADSERLLANCRYSIPFFLQPFPFE